MRRWEEDDWRFAVVWSLGAAVVIALVVWASGCAPVQKPPQALNTWGHDSARIVISGDAPDCFFWAVTDALDLLRPNVAVTVERGLEAEPRQGEIVLRWRHPEGSLGLASLWIERGQVTRAYVDVPLCRVRLVAHELGHAFGLLNVEEHGRLMNGAYNVGGYGVTEDERAALRRQRVLLP